MGNLLVTLLINIQGVKSIAAIFKQTNIQGRQISCCNIYTNKYSGETNVLLQYLNKQIFRGDKSVTAIFYANIYKTIFQYRNTKITDKKVA